MSRISFNEAKIKKIELEGRGKGTLCDYKPWPAVAMASSHAEVTLADFCSLLDSLNCWKSE